MRHNFFTEDYNEKAMSNISRLTLFDSALKQCRLKLKTDPEFSPLRSIERQLIYLIDVESGNTLDRTQLSEISVGLLVAREIETYNMKLAETLYQVTEAVTEMQYGR